MQTQKIQLAELSLKDIQPSPSNKIFRDSSELDEKALRELTDSIKQKGVLQPILVRPTEIKGKYALVCGERRYQASLLAGTETIPASIRELNDEESFDLMITENLERADIHPMKEAKGYEHILGRNPLVKTSDLALKFAKSESYILQRLKLNELIPEGAKDFTSGKMTLAHALLIAKLTPENQKECIRENSDRNEGYSSVANLNEYIQRHIINELSAAPFDKADTTLLPVAGACTNCPKKSGNSPLLFPEVKKKDRCMDKNCFNKKCKMFITHRVQEVINTEPGTVFIRGYQDPIDEVTKQLDEHQIKSFREYKDFSAHDKKGKKTTALWVSGEMAGHTVQVVLNIQTEKGDEPAQQKGTIARIRERLSRSTELDSEKVHAKIIEAFRNHPYLEKTAAKKTTEAEENFLWFMIYDKAGYTTKEHLRKTLKLSDSDPTKFFNRIAGLDPFEKAHMLRQVIADQYCGNYPNTTFAYILRKIADSYKDIDIATFENEQKQVREQREERAEARIKALKQKPSKAK